MCPGLSRRGFLTDVSRNMLAAGIGWSAVVDMGFAPHAWADVPEKALNFGELESLVDLLQSTPVERLLPALTSQLQGGTSLRTLLQAGVLANCRSFAGEDYIGFHTLMALGPALAISAEMPVEEQALPVLKVLYRNTARIQANGGREREQLHHVPALATIGAEPRLDLRTACRQQNLADAEGLLVGLSVADPSAAYSALLYAVEDETEVHRVNLAYRAWDLLNIVGVEHAATLLRQSLRYCIKAESSARFETREMLQSVFDQYRLEALTTGTRALDDTALEELAGVFLTATPSEAAHAAAAALAEGIAADSVAQAAALTANQLLLRDPGRPERYSDAKKPPGSVHGDSIGVHSCDAVNAWRNIAKATSGHHQHAAVVLAAWQVARDRSAVDWAGRSLSEITPRPWSEDLEPLRGQSTSRLLAEAEDAIRHNQQARASAAVHLMGEQQGDPAAAFALLRRFAISEDGALHAEKFYRTASDEFATLPAAFRWRQLTGLARVTASEFGQPAPGVAEARALLKLT